jgi:glycosyltransferase involved in cell wall biosynthesis
VSGTRVVHLSPMAFGADGLYGGGERYALELARHMADAVPTRLVTFADRPRRERVGDLEVVVLGPPWYVRGQRFNPLHAGIVRQVAWASVVHCHQRHVLASTLAAGLCRLAGRRVFVSDLGGGGWDISAYLPAVGRLYHGFLHLSQYSRGLTPTEATRSRIIYGGADADKFSPPADPTPRAGGPVVFVGRILPHKGIIDLVEAVPPDLPLEVIGREVDAGYATQLRRAAAGKRVTFRHDATDADIIAAYRRALCVALPSVYRTRDGAETRVPELLGQTLIEGMACGAPGVCTAVASLPEVVATGETGFVVPPNDPPALRAKLEWLRDHPAEAARMGAAARRRVLAHFSWPAVVRACLAAYHGESSSA